MVFLWDSHGILMGSSWDDHMKTIGLSWDDLGIIMGLSWGYHGDCEWVSLQRWSIFSDYLFLCFSQTIDYGPFEHRAGY